MYKLLIIACLLSGCGNFDDNFACNNQYIHVISDHHFNVDNFGLNLGQAGRILSPLMTQNEFCDTYSRPLIQIMDTPSFSCISYTTGCSGLTGIFGVQLNSDGYAMVHEFIHVYQMKQLELGTIDHKDWDKLGYTAMDNEFQQVYYRLDE